ncbi:MAG: aldo/keto reductase [Xanthomonadales bacterium]|nr:aldo/keto reductase [Xanthomonadales bacterium]NIN60387.1 aldo/keto reductase [Xanthomonadales bacterium]NIN75740.1 aldo/keto reductase [Xanthomonadales bacterium]NIO14302.1 aldo/keto reductase [Xanthomonadales bacterium]NIP12780.1 aldo/keto reductase [Xanthomonadales bacterium]
MEYLSFRNGDRMPAVGLGTWKAGPDEVYGAVREAIRAGFRHIDCAPIYDNEPAVGAALSDAIGAGEVRRDQLWITSKLWNSDHHRDRVQPALESSLRDLGLEYLDLFLVHWPVALRAGVGFPTHADDFLSEAQAPRGETWQGMEHCARIGLARHIGVSNFSVTKLAALMAACEIAPEVNQVEAHPYLQQDSLLDYCRAHGIHLTAFSPLGSPDRSPATKGADEPSLLADPVIAAIAERHGVGPARVLLAWHVQRGAAVIPKSVDPAHLRDNLAAAGLRLDTRDLAAIADLDQNYRFIRGSFLAIEGSPHTAATLWDD